MLSSLVPIVVVVVVLCWIVAPVAVLLAVIGPAGRRVNPVWVRPCSAHDGSGPGSSPCWVAVGGEEFCSRHEQSRPRPEGWANEVLIG